MAAASLDLEIEQGGTYSLVMVYRDATGALVDLTGYTAKLGLKHEYGPAAPDLLLTEASGLALGGAAGTIVLTITAAQTAALAFDSYHYDLSVTKNGVADSLLRGEARVERSASQ